jgi:hypothetical protein
VAYISVEAAHEHRERLLLELIRALLSLAGEEAQVSVITPEGNEPLSLRGMLTRPFRQPMDPDVITLGFALNAFTLDLHLRDLADLRRWDFRAGDEQAAGVVLVLADGTIIEIDQANQESTRTSPPA